MKRALLLAILTSLALPGSGRAATPATITLKSPDVLFEQLREMGYAPEPFDETNTPTAIIHTQEGKLAVTLGGCTMRKNCTYVVLSSNFSDVKNAPADWVAARNSDFDLIKVWVNGDGNLTYSAGFLAEGMDRAIFRAWIDSTEASGADLARQVIKGGLVKP